MYYSSYPQFPYPDDWRSWGIEKEDDDDNEDNWLNPIKVSLIKVGFSFSYREFIDASFIKNWFVLKGINISVSLCIFRQCQFKISCIRYNFHDSRIKEMFLLNISTSHFGKIYAHLCAVNNKDNGLRIKFILIDYFIISFEMTEYNHMI